MAAKVGDWQLLQAGSICTRRGICILQIRSDGTRRPAVKQGGGGCIKGCGGRGRGGIASSTNGAFCYAARKTFAQQQQQQQTRTTSTTTTTTFSSPQRARFISAWQICSKPQRSHLTYPLHTPVQPLQRLHFAFCHCTCRCKLIFVQQPQL